MDDEFRHALMGALGYSELLKKFERFEKSQEKIWKEIRKIWEEIRELRKNREKLFAGQERLWESQQRLWEEINHVRRDVMDVRRMQERYCLTLEEEANEIVEYFLGKRGIKVKLSLVTFDEKYEFDIYGATEGLTVVGEAKIGGSARQIERMDERIKEASKMWPEKFTDKIVKVFYCMRALSGTEEEARKRRVWLIVSNREVTEPDL